jgi:ribosomal protein S18 acetylase RimI-like enzyme
MDAARCRLWLIRLGQTLGGMIRFDRAGVTAVVSLYVAEPYRGQGIGQRAFLRAWSHRPSWAQAAEALVREDNARGQAFFARLGFQEIARLDHDGCGLIRYRRPADAAG